MIEIKDIIEGKISMNSSGSAYLVSDKLPKDIYIHRKNTNKSFHLDTVKVEVIPGVGRALEGRVIEIIERFRTEFIGVIEVSEKFAFFVPDSNKLPIDFYIPLKKLNGATNGQKVIVEMTRWGDDAKNPNGKILRIIGDAGDHDTEIHSILEEYGLPYEFDEDVIAESEAISEIITEEEIGKRRDMRDVLTFTIDPNDAKDFDDALSVEWVNGVLNVGIHIADVSHYLRPDTALDKEAYARGTSVYLVDRVVPMLPERLSNGLCSLRPHEDKLCFSALFALDNNGAVMNEWFGRTVIHSNHRFTYEEAQMIIEDGMDVSDVAFDNPENRAGAMDSVSILGDLTRGIMDLDRYAKIMRKSRLKGGAISFDKQEMKFKLDEDNKPTDIIFKTSKDANKLIEEFMLLANKRVSKFVNDKKLPMINRVHESPLPEKLTALREFIKQFGYDIKTDTPDHVKESLNKLLEDVKGKPEGSMIETLVLRTMQKAVYMTDNMGHYGLGFRDYSHFTSPIRRYPDVIAHRLLHTYLNGKPTPKLMKLDGRATYLSERENKAKKAERDSNKYMQAMYMSERIGKIFTAIVSSVLDFGIFVEIEENKCQCLVRLSEIEGTWSADMENYQIKEHNTGEVVKLADTVSIVIHSVDLERKAIDARLIKL